MRLFFDRTTFNYFPGPSPLVIGICGGSASGKTSVAKNVIEGIDVPWVVLLAMDSFYKGITSEKDKELALTGDYNFDHPDAFDWDAVNESKEFVPY